MASSAPPPPPQSAQTGQTAGERAITIGILTYKRPESLTATLESLLGLEIDRLPPPWHLCDVLIIDNDAEPSARAAVDSLVERGYPLPVTYRHEPRPGLAAARNRALDDARGDVLVFIDDDEQAEPGWPGGLLTTMEATGAALVGGPVRTAFVCEPPAWIRSGGFFDRDEPPDRTPQTWLRSGNLAIDLTLVRDRALRFDPRFGHSGGEDTAFSLRAARLGLGLQWSATAAVTETVGPDRTRLRWLLRRERRSAANWVRVELLEHPGPGRRLLVAARASVRLLEGAALTLGGTVSARRSVAARGLIRLWRGVGSLHGLVGGTSTAYGADSTAYGPDNTAYGPDNTAYGPDNTA